MSSEVRNRIASYEAQNKEVRRPSHSSGGSPAHHKRQDQAGGMEMSSGNGSTSTALAAQNRVSRMRQEQLTRDGKSHQSNLVEKRKLLKERRILQQKRTPASEVHVGPDNATTDAASIPQSVDPPRRSGASEETDKDAALHSSSPGRSGTSRLAKMHRMQKMKGYDPPKRTAKVNPSVPAKPSMAASSTASTATTAVAHNSANKLQRRQRQTTLMQTLAKRASVVSQRATPAMPDNGASPQPPSRSFLHLSAASPKSDIDALSDNNYAYVATDQSVEPTTDDEATLTSVRRIMTRENVDDSTPREKSHHYHHLQAQSSRGDDSIHASHRSGRTTTTPAFSQGTVQNKRAGKSSTTNTRSRLEKRRNWPHEEKSDKGSIPDVFRAASSSDYDTDGDVSKCSRQSNALDGPTQSQATDVNDFFAKSRYAQTNRRVDDDERTFDYGDKDDDSNGSTSFAMRQRRGAEQPSPEEGPSNEWKEPKPPAGPSSLINKEDVEHYTKSMGSPALKIGAGVIGAFTVGCIVLGPAGLLAGAACIGLGVGVMQIPEEERQKIQAKVHQTVSKVHEQAVDATEKFSNSCAATYEESGVAEHLPPCLSLPVAENAGSKDHDSAPSEKRVARATAEESTSGPKAAPVVAAAPPPLLHEINNQKSEQGNNMDRLRNKKVACLRKGMWLYGFCILCLSSTSSQLSLVLQLESFPQPKFTGLILRLNRKLGWMSSQVPIHRKMKKPKRWKRS